MKTFNWKEIFMMVLAVLIVLGTMATIIILMKYEVPKENKDALYLILGVLTASITTIVNYFFGSSKGSAEKNDIIANSTPVKNGQ